MSRTAVLIAGASAALVSCAPTMSSSRYTATQVGAINRAVNGRVVSVRAVSVDRSSGVGGAAGAGVGAVAGASLGGDTGGSIAGAIVGAVAGGVAGAAMEHRISRTPAYEYVVRTENGAMMTLVQGEPALQIGAGVILLYGSPPRLIPDPAAAR